MHWILRNIGTTTVLAFALAGFLGELAGALPEQAGALVTSASLLALAIGRGLVVAAEILRSGEPPA